MKALSIFQPWAWAIFNAGRNVENRNCLTPHRGPLLIYASKTRFKDDWQNAVEWMCEYVPGLLEDILIPDMENLDLGGIIGRVELVDCIRNSNSPWAMEGQIHWILKNPEPWSFSPSKTNSRGRGVYEVEHEIQGDGQNVRS